MMFIIIMVGGLMFGCFPKFMFTMSAICIAVVAAAVLTHG
jgi:hypothetical protein